MYKQARKNPDGTDQNFVIRVSDGALIPFDLSNIDYQQYLAWLAEGNTPLPPDTPSPTP